MSSDNTVLWLAFHQSCSNPGAPPRQKNCIMRSGSRNRYKCLRDELVRPRLLVIQDFVIVKKNMDFYYPTLTFDGSKALGTNTMIVGFGGSNSTVFPSLFASGQRGTITFTH